MKNLFIIMTLILTLSGCKQEPTTVPISLTWEMGQNEIEPGVYENTFYISNDGNESLNKNWILYFNQLPAAPIPNPEGAFVVEEISSTYYRMFPSANYKPIAAGDTVKFTFRCKGNIIKETNAPEGAYAVKLNNDGKEAGKPHSVEIKVTPFMHEYQWARKGRAELPYPYGDIVYEQNKFFENGLVGDADISIIPALKKVDKRQGEHHITKNIRIAHDGSFDNEAGLLKEKLESMFQATVSDAGETTIELKKLTNPKVKNNPEYYEIKTADKQITISGVTPHAVSNGAQTLLAIIGNLNGLPCHTASLYIEDYPDLLHRGQMIDVARNFSSKENIMKLIDIFAMYKLNILHFHIVDDEGWRIEIPGLPELTEVGARRGHTLDEADRLYPAYGGGCDFTEAGTGYYTRQEFIEILRYAKRRHITVLPEIDMPGHSRAAIVAMNARYNKYIDTDLAKAEEFLLADFEDTSKYLSAQWYTDNVINAAMPSAYRFVEKVINEVESMYKEAGMELNVLHMGGDEVPHGAWEGSSIARAFMQEKGMTQARDLKDYFFAQVLDILDEKNIQLAGWQEVVLMPDEKTVNERFAKRNVLTYCWNTIPEQGSDQIPYNLANAGYPIVLCNVTNFYMDMSYNKHQHEPGLYWGGFVNEYVPYDVLPYDIYKSIRHNMKGEKVDIVQASKTKVPLARDARAQIKGIQGQLWAETIRNFGMVEKALFPKMLGMIDRAWNTEPSWGFSNDETKHDDALRAYNAALNQYEYPRLNGFGVNFHVSQPGIKIIDGKLHANSTLKDAVIRYTIDGSEPNENSPVWTAPIDCDAKQVKAKTYFMGKESVTSIIHI
ncbi:family 20 glycosylhydrolase [Bacteroides sp. 519]|uniref:family 20 glycosylhydrolase n=1 Tax=Bacteroides sp. 519 TaxID=2302937 RepID=UPI001EF1683D|nr:family 20 glycosylhydrolase [Bacteroides sp. 519]